MSLQFQETDPSSRPQPGTHHFLIQALPEPSVLSRVLELFALRDLLPNEVTCKSPAGENGELHIHIAMAGLPRQKAAHLAARMRNIVPVSRVVLEPAEG
jgi:acetolactate synthase small subunit